jgi:Zn-dependent protease with chaperone function
MASVGQLNFRSFVGTSEADTSVETEVTRNVAYAYSSDKDTKAAFANVAFLERAAKGAVKYFKEYGKNEILGHAVKVGPRQFPRVHDLSAECAKTLGIAQPALYIVNNPTLNAMTFGTDDDSFILVHSALIDHFSDEELLSVIGHEAGHIHNKHVIYMTALRYMTTVASMFVRWISAPIGVALSSWQRRAEITCDRAGLLCSRDYEVSKRALAKLALGSTKLYSEFNIDAFLDQYQEGQEGIGKYSELTAHHPFLPKRILALKAFTESELYRNHIGLSEGFSMEDVDQRVHGIIKVVG